MCWFVVCSPFSRSVALETGSGSSPQAPGLLAAPMGHAGRGGGSRWTEGDRTGVLAHRERSLCCLGLCGPETTWDDPWLPVLPPSWCLEERPRAGSPDLSGAVLARGLTHVCSLWPWVVILAGSVARALWNTPEHSGTLWNTLDMVTHACDIDRCCPPPASPLCPEAGTQSHSRLCAQRHLLHWEALAVP